MTKNKEKKQFIIKNFGFAFCYFEFLIAVILNIICFILISNREIIVSMLIVLIFVDILLFIALFFVIKEHISEIKEYKVILLKKELLSSKNIIGKLGEGKMLRGRDDK